MLATQVVALDHGGETVLVRVCVVAHTSAGASAAPRHVRRKGHRDGREAAASNVAATVRRHDARGPDGDRRAARQSERLAAVRVSSDGPASASSDGPLLPLPVRLSRSVRTADVRPVLSPHRRHTEETDDGGSRLALDGEEERSEFVAVFVMLVGAVERNKRCCMALTCALH